MPQLATRRVAVSLLGSVLWLALAATPAHAAAVYSEKTPSAGSAVAEKAPAISVKVTNTTTIMSGSQLMKIDGASKTAKLTYVGTGGTTAIVSLKSPLALKNGTHTAYASVFSGGRTSTTWSFIVRVPPAIGPMAPADGSTTNSQTPAVSAVVTPNGVGLSSFAMTVDGAAVDATYDAASKTVSYTPATPLANDRVHDVTLSVTDAAGASSSVSWSFRVQTYADMADTVGCTECHIGYPTSHPMTDCWGCHDTEAPYPAYWYMDPSQAPHSTSFIVGEDCTYCHSTVFPGVPVHVPDVGGAHYTSDDMSGCACHVRNLSNEHARYTDDAGAPITCLTCHQSPDPAVQAALAAGSTACAGCHTIHGDLAAIHAATSETSLACAEAGCHETGDAAAIHAQRPEGECAVCHANPTRGDLTAGKSSADCEGCHSAEGIDYHAQMAVSHASPTSASCFGAGCHDPSKSLPAVHALYAGPDSENPGYATSCGLCHSNPAVDVSTSGASCTPVCHDGFTHSEYASSHAVTAASAACTQCHGSDLSGVHGADVDFAKCATCHANPGNWAKTAECGSCHGGHADLGATHTATSVTSQTCAQVGCHDTADAIVLHADRPEGECLVCHANPARGDLTAGKTVADCEGCHTTQGVDYHVELAVRHTNTAMDPSCLSAGCHTNALAEEHAAYVGSGGRYPAYADSCALCHQNTDPGRIPAGATADCASCHTLHGDLSLAHEATPFAGHVDLVGAADPAAPNADCGDCHGAVLETAHDSGAGAGVDVDCLMCHTSSNLLTLHPAGCETCHSSTGGAAAGVGTWNRTCQQADCHATYHVQAREGHRLVSCEACHDHSTLFAVTFDRCGSCHTIYDTIPPTTISDAVAVYAGSATIALTATDGSQTGVGGVARTYYVLDGGEETEGSLVNVPVPASGSETHVLRFWSVDIAGNVEPANSVIFTVMNIVDTTTPTGSMVVNGGATYATARQATLDSSVTDSETGVWQMRVDRGTGTFGDWIDYAPTYAIYLNGAQGTNTVRVEYRDYASNVLQLTDTIVLDLSAPATTSDSAATYSGTATIHLTASDAGSGVAHTYYILDAGPQMEGTMIAVPAPETGSAEHTLEYWSVDYAGRIESRRVDTFTVLAPATEVGTIELATSDAPEMDWYSWQVLDSGGAVVASGFEAMPVPAVLPVAVPVDPQPYSVVIELSWYDTYFPPRTFSALVDAPGKIARVDF